MMNIAKWSFSRKLLTVNMAYLLPCALLIFFLTKEKNNQIEFSAKEVYGIEYSRVLVNILIHASQHKLYTERDDAELATKIKAMEAQIDRDLHNLEEVDQKYGEVLLFTDAELNARNKSQASYKMLKGQWQALMEKASERETQYRQFFANVRMAISHATDSSNLILDPDLDSYYVMDVVSGALPQFIESQRDLITHARTKAAEDEGAQRKNLLELASFTQGLQNLLVRIQDGMQTTLNEDKSFYGQLPSLQKQLPNQVNTFSSAQERLIKTLKAGLSAGVEGQSIELGNEFFGNALESLGATQVFYEQMSEMLDDLVQVRIAQHSAERWQALVLTLLIWLIPATLSVLTVRRLGQSFGNAVARLLTQSDAAHQSSRQLAQASSVVSTGSTEQAAALQETGASMSEMASMIARTTDQASNSQQLASRVAQKAEEGCSVMEKMVLSMDSIQQANSQLQNISNIINEISNKTNMINDIVGKTQLLSFNASIEAARAGQHGRGFAVVAEEVGNLAQTSGKAAKGIRDLIEDSQKQVAHILQLTLERVADGKKVTEQAQTIFSGIAGDIVLISDQVESVSEAAREQQFGIEQISKAMLQMDQTTRTNNSAAQTAAQLSDQLSGQSRKLSVIAQSVSGLVFGDKPMAKAPQAKVESTPVPAQEPVSADNQALLDKIVNQAQSPESIDSIHADDSSFRKVS